MTHQKKPGRQGWEKFPDLVSKPHVPTHIQLAPCLAVVVLPFPYNVIFIAERHRM